MNTFLRLPWIDIRTFKHVGYLMCRHESGMVHYLNDFYNFLILDTAEQFNPFGSGGRPIHVESGCVRIDEVKIPEGMIFKCDIKTGPDDENFEVTPTSVNSRSWFLIRSLERVQSNVSVRFTEGYHYDPEQVFTIIPSSESRDNLVPRTVFETKQTALRAMRPAFRVVTNGENGSDLQKPNPKLRPPTHG